MLLMTLFSTASALAMTLPLTSSPVIMGVWVLIFAMLSAILTAFLSTSWFGFILFIIYIGGMLVMFSYFSAISPNQHMKMSSSALIALLLSGSIYFFLFKALSVFPFSSISHSAHAPSFIMLFSKSNLPILIFLALLLLLALILVVKLTQRSEGPLRPFK
uniref:NADH dehydrogenase subunit 6 n=1 Tax=Pectinaria gouldii TaxID=260746 RepID=G8XXK3_PECGU|nr:NADH dehydrogenase subunit 6 [Pectinaria gouldii]